MVAGAAAAVLAVVVAIVVVACNGPSPAGKKDAGGQSPASTGGGHSSSRPAAPSPSGSPGHSRRPHRHSGTGKHRTVATFSGTGPAKTKRFLVLGTGDWTLDWSYHCPASGRFTVSEDGGTDINGVQLAKHGSSGQGQAKVFGDTGHHFLTVTSACTWQLTVAGKG